MYLFNVLYMGVKIYQRTLLNRKHKIIAKYFNLISLMFK